MDLKRAYLIRRNPGLSAEQFPPRWRRHVALGQQFPELAQRYRHIRYCHALHEADGVGGDNPGFDGVGFLTLRHAGELAKPYQDATIGPTMREDELRVFSDHVFNSALTATETVLKPGGGTIGVLQFLRRRAGTGRDAFTRHWQDQHAPLVLARAPGLRRYVQNQVQGEPTIDFDGLAEMWFDDLPAALAALRHTGFAGAVTADRLRFTDPTATVTLITEIIHEAEYAA